MKAAKRAFGADGFEVAFECAGVEATITAAVECIQKGGTIIVVGVFGDKPRVDLGFVQDRELTLRGTLMYKRADYRRAIERWQLALERDPENEMIQEYIERAKTELEDEVNRAIYRANQLMRQEDISEAYRVLNRVKEQTEGNESLNRRVLNQIRALDQSVDFNTNLQKGMERFQAGDYEAAARYFERAMRINPQDVEAKELYQSAFVRTKAGKQELTGEAFEIYKQGMSLFVEGRYQEAIRMWERALELEPNNARILKNIEDAREKIEAYKKKE